MSSPSDTATTDAPAPPQGFSELFSSRLLIVTGKGGVGKTTVAAALAIAGANSGRRTLLVEVEGRQGFSRIFRTQPWDYEEREFRPGLWGTAIDPEHSVYEYLEMYYGLKRVSWVMSRTSAMDFVTAAAPGLRDLLLIGKVYEIEKRRREDGRPVYDLLILDAPPTGRIVPFLKAPEGVTEIVRVGPVKRQAGNVSTMLTDPRRTQIVPVTLLEEMPVTETAEAVDHLREADIEIGPVVANQALRRRLSDEEAAALGELGHEGLTDRASEVGAALDTDAAQLAIDQIDAHLERLELQQRMREELLERTHQPVIGLPLLTGATFDESDLEILADELAVAIGERGPKAGRRVAGGQAGGASG